MNNAVDLTLQSGGTHGIFVVLSDDDLLPEWIEVDGYPVTMSEPEQIRFDIPTFRIFCMTENPDRKAPVESMTHSKNPHAGYLCKKLAGSWT